MDEIRAKLQRARAAKARAVRQFEKLPDVNGIGLTRRGDDFALKINFEREPKVEIPRRIDDVDVVVEVVGKIRKLATRKRPAKKTATRVHVKPRDGRWAVTRHGNKRASSVHDTQRDAIKVARELARRASGELVIHGRDGAIRERDSYSG